MPGSIFREAGVIDEENAHFFLAIAILLTSVLAASCSKKIPDDDDFEDVLEDFDFEVYEVKDGLSRKVDKRINAYDEDYDFAAYYIEYDDKDDAKDEFEDLLDDIKDAKRDRDFEGKISESGFGNYNKLIVNGDFDDSINEIPEGRFYGVIYRIDNVVLVVAAMDNDRRDIKQVNEILKKLGY
ncbi:MAG: hypothetical protein GX099_00690 [Clostridiaceae bacterium]|nr:hypothetical protein [Clostridiaceae bacterium]